MFFNPSSDVKNAQTLNVKECLEQINNYLSQHELYFGHGTDNAWDEACWLMQTVLKRYGINELQEKTPLTSQHLNDLEAILSRRAAEKQPLAYLLNEAWFAGLPFYVDQRVLVPRSPLAELIQNDFSGLLNRSPKSLLDLCCGSGCIGIASAMAFPEATVVLADLSDKALEVADINRQKYGLTERVALVESNLFDGIDGQFDLILSNPPYVSQEEYDALPVEYHQEPEMGLVSLNNGLEIPIKILKETAKYLKDDGILILEVGYSWQALEKALPEYPFLWLDFEFGGEGICLLKKQQLLALT